MDVAEQAGDGHDGRDLVQDDERGEVGHGLVGEECCVFLELRGSLCGGTRRGWCSREQESMPRRGAHQRAQEGSHCALCRMDM